MARRRIRIQGHSDHLPSAWFLTDPQRTPNPLPIMQKLPCGWGVIYRHFGSADRHDLAYAMLKSAQKRKLVFCVSWDDQMDLTRFDGVHWPRWALTGSKPSLDFRQINTTSAHSREQIAQATKFKMEACFLSALFPSKSASAPPPIGVHRLARLQKSSRIPLVALGGINGSNSLKVANLTSFAAIEGVNKAFD